MPPNRFESEVESFLEGSHGDRTHIKRADHHTVTPLCGTLLHNKGLTRIFRGPHARNTPHQRPLRPNRTPPRPQHPIFSIFHRSGLCFGRCTTPSRNLAATNRGEITPSKPPTRRRRATRRLRMAQTPHCHAASKPPGWHTPPNWIGNNNLDRLLRSG